MDDREKLIRVLNAIRPNAEWVLANDKLEWHDKVQTQPTDDEIQTALANYTTLLYGELRRREYPSIGDQLDAVMKGGQALADMQAACMAIKAKYPKGA